MIPSPVTINNFPDILTGILYYVQFLAYIIAVSGLITYVCVYLIIINLLLNLRSTKDIKWKILLIIMISYRSINSLYNNHDNVSKFCVLGGRGVTVKKDNSNTWLRKRSPCGEWNDVTVSLLYFKLTTKNVSNIKFKWPISWTHQYLYV